MTNLFNNFEGGTSGTNLSTGNSGGASGTAFDTVVIGGSATLQFASAQMAHGQLSLLCQTTAANATSAAWTTSFGTPTQCWFRCYMYFAANPAGSSRFFTVANTGGTGLVRFAINTSGKILVQDDAGATITTSTAAVPTGSWFRIEGMAIMSASVGQTEVKLFKNPDSLAADETDTSAASHATLTGTILSYAFGPLAAVANQGPYYLDDIGLSSVGYLGPVNNPSDVPAAAPGPAWLSYYKPYAPRPHPQICIPGFQQLGKQLNVTVSTAGTIQDQAGKTLAASVTTTGTAQDQVSKTLAAPVTATGTVTKQVNRAFAVAVTTAATLARNPGKTLSAAVTTAAALVRNPGKALPATVTTSASLGARALTRTFAVTVAAAASVARTLPRTFTVTVTATASLAKNPRKTFTATVATASSLARSIGKTLRATVTAVASLLLKAPVQPAVITITPGIAAGVAVSSGIAAAVAITPAGNAAAVVTATARTGPGGSITLHP